MSYLGSLLKRYGKRPVWLITLTRGATVYRYTFGSKAISFGGATFQPMSIIFRELTYSSDLKKDDFTLSGFPLSHPDTQAIIASGSEATTVQVQRGFMGLDEVIVAYAGTLTSKRFGGSYVDLVFSSWARILSRRAEGPVLQRQCPWRLYSTQCGVVQATFTTAGTATVYDAAVVTVAAAAGEADGFFTGGQLTFGANARTITKHTGSSLTLAAGFPELADAIAGSPGSPAVAIAAGCDKSATTCEGRFNNIQAHLGFSSMSDDPFYKVQI